MRIDDALDVFAVHGVGGMFGAVATGVLAVAAIGGVSGAIEGNLAQVGIQLVAVAAAAAFAAIGTFVIVKSIEFVLGLRVEPQQEELAWISRCTARSRTSPRRPLRGSPQPDRNRRDTPPPLTSESRKPTLLASAIRPSPDFCLRVMRVAR